MKQRDRTELLKQQIERFDLSLPFSFADPDDAVTLYRYPTGALW
jgi:hypothetical protein